MTAIARHRSTPSLDDVQSRIEATPRGALTLDPDREFATPLPALVRSLASPAAEGPLAAAAASVAIAQLENFPDNLFWDFDAYLASLHRHAIAHGAYEEYLARASATTETLMRLYGQQSKIRFRYVHDFVYGFDWARWVQRDPATRSDEEPFGIAFLDQSERRGRRILELIDADDEWYPQLRTSASRNPFSFSRDPDDELELYGALSRRGCVPVKAWMANGHFAWDRDFDALRNECATSLGLQRERDNP